MLHEQLSRRQAGTALGLVVLAGLACVSKPARGPTFEAVSAPTRTEALLYLYRDDRAKPLGRPVLRLNGVELEELRNGEYHPLYLTPGPHRLDLALKAGFLPSTWNSVSFCLKEGSTNALRIWSAYQQTDSDPSQIMERAAPGRDDVRANMGIFALRVSLESAQGTLARSTRAPWLRRSLYANSLEGELGDSRNPWNGAEPCAGRGGGI